MAAGIGPLILVISATAVIAAAQDRPAKASPSPEPQTKPCPAVGSSAPGAPKPDQGNKPGGPRKDWGFPGGPVDAEKAREAFKNMSPEERERWMRRFRDWADMPPERKKSLADREEFFKRKMREDVEAAQKELGFELNEDQKKLFSERYVEERRKVEEELRREMEASRGPKVKALIEKLRQEFAAQPAKPQ
jgi:hypothetical protein